MTKTLPFSSSDIEKVRNDSQLPADEIMKIMRREGAALCRRLSKQFSCIGSGIKSATCDLPGAIPCTLIVISQFGADGPLLRPWGWP